MYNMSQSYKRNADEQIDQHKTKASRGEEDVESNGTTSTEYDRTEINDVFVASQAPSPRAARDDLVDWDDPIILVISKSARDNYWAYLKRMMDEPSTTAPLLTATSNETRVESENIHLNTGLSQELKEGFSNVTHKLDDIIKGFSEATLKTNLDSDTDFNRFKDIRKEFTDFYIFGAKTMNMMEKFTCGQKHHLLTTAANFVLNKLNADFIRQIYTQIEQTTTTLNVQMYNETLLELQKTFETVDKIITQDHPRLIAKAWRTVRLSNKNIKTHSFEYSHRLSDKPKRDTYVYKHQNTDRDYNNRKAEGPRDERNTYYSRNYLSLIHI